MTTRFYLKTDTKLKRARLPNGGDSFFHHSTNLFVYQDAGGSYTEVEWDLYVNPHFTPRSDLLVDVCAISCKFNAREACYLKNIPIGEYGLADDQVVITLGRKLSYYDKSEGREMTVVAATWEQIIAAVAKIRNGEIKPLESEQTLLEELQEKLVLANQLNVGQAGKIQELNHALGLANMHAGDQLRFMTFVAEFLTGARDKLSIGMSKEEEVKTLHDVAWLTRCSVTELAHIKSGRWHKLGQFISRILGGSVHTSTN